MKEYALVYQRNIKSMHIKFQKIVGTILLMLAL